MKDSDYHPIYSEPLFNNKLFPVIIIDDKGTITDCNQKTADTFGIQKPQLIGTSAKDLFLSESALHPVASTAEVSALTRDKKILHFEYTFEKVSLPEHGKSHGYIILSEKPVPEIKDEDLDSLSRKIFESRTVGFTLLNDELKVIKINDAILKLLGFEPTEVVNKHIHSLGVLGTKASDESELIWKKIREAGSMKNIERQLISKTGKAITLQVSIDHFYLDDKRYWIITSNDISMKKESDLYLQNAFQKLAHHLNNSPLGIVEYDNHLIVTEWSSQSENIFKWSKAEILNNNIGAFNLIYEEDIEATTKIAEELLSGKVSGNISYNRNYTKDGDIIHCVWYNSAVKNENGEVISIMSLVQDVTASKQLEQELINSKKELELFFSNSIYGFFFMMLDKPVIWNDQVNKEDVLEYVFDHQRITKINQAMLDQYKASYEDLIGLTPRDFFEHDIEAGKQSWISLFDHGKLRIDTHEKRFDGSDFWVEGDYKLLRNEKNEIIGHFGIQHDITEKKKALYKLEESERNFRILFNNASDGIFITDGVGNFIDVNEGACHMTGYSKSELVHMHVRSILSPECLSLIHI